MAILKPAVMALAILWAGTAGAQEQAPSPAAPAETTQAETAPAATPAPAPTPLPLLMGPAYDTLKQLALVLRTEAGHALDGTQAAAAAGHPSRLFMPGIRMFTRRTEWFRQAVENYRSQPFDIVGTVDMMHGRANMLGRRMRNSSALQQTWEDWDLMVDVLGRMQRLLAGEKVALPPPHTPRPPVAATPAPPLRSPSPTPR
jgi:hypothetical protein